jgi:Tol biopolymer transport system component
MSPLSPAVRVAVAALVLFAPAAATAAPLRLVSANGQEQATAASAPALSANGRYIAFQGSLGGTTGVLRKDLLTGGVELVAGGSAYQPDAPGADASAPSISADGRYVSFTTRASLDQAADTGNGQSVYVRDMALPAPAGGACTPGTDPCAFELASVRDGTAAAALPAAIASGRVALSADGRRVAFVTTADSDLASAPGDMATPAGQVAVRDLDRDRTALVSVVRDPATGAPTDPPQPIPGGAVPAAAPGAALSADGTTVAWLGAHLPAQVPLLTDEAQAIAIDDGDDSTAYVEPLWRRIGDGPTAPTRRIVGGGDPLAPACPPGGTLTDPACQGPFPAIAGNRFLRDRSTGWFGLPGNGLPQLSADGRTVALIGDPTGIANVYLVDMHESLTRRQALRPLTREVPILDPEQANTVDDIPRAGDIRDIGISPDGLHVAFTTGRSQFPLAPPSLVGAPLAALGLVELYRADLDTETLRRVTVPESGGPSLGSGLLVQEGSGASAPSFTTDGSTLAFGSEASNLVAGDANGAGDAFVVSENVAADTPPQLQISPPPAPLRPRPRWRITATASSRRDGRVQLEVTVPGAGLVRTRATSVLTLRGRAAAKRGHARRVRLARRTVASARRRARADGLVRLQLTLARPYGRLARAPRGLDGTVAVAFAGRGGRPLHDELDVRFRIEHPARRGKR